MQTVRRVVGRSNGEEGCIAMLALRAVDEAHGFGLTVKSNRVSRSRSHTTSRYLRVEDAKGRIWHLRLSNHYRPNKTPHAPPHFDLVSLDGNSGLAEIRRFLIAITCGDAQWWDREGMDRKPRKKRKRNAKRFIGRDRRR